jgi:hypothetical protein
MRTGSEDEDGSDGQIGSKTGNDGSSYWEKSQKVGFLQAGAITADMINTGSLVADVGFINKLKTSELTIDASKVTELDNAITKSAVIANIKADTEKSITEFRNTFTTEVEGQITDAEASVKSYADKTFATTEQVSKFKSDLEGQITDAEAGVKSYADKTFATTEQVSKFKSDLEGQISTATAGVITTANAKDALAGMFASKEDVDGKVSKASIIAEINNAGSEVKIDADKITLTAQMIEATNFTVDAAKIKGILTAENIETSPDLEEDKIFIKDNYIKILSNDGYRNIIISSDEISEDFEPENIFDNDYMSRVCVFENNKLSMEKVSSASKAYNNSSKAVNLLSSTIFNNSGTINSITLCFSLKTDESKQNITGPTDGLYVSNWGLSTTSTFRMKINIYKINKDLSLERIGNPIPIESLGAAANAPWAVGGTQYPSIYNHVYNAMISPKIQLTDNGRYAFELEIPARCLSITGVDSVTNPVLSVSFIMGIDRKLENYTEIGKNGLITKSNNCSLYINNDVIQMVASKDNKGNAYGFKVTTDGIYYKNGTGTWIRWTPS